MTKFLEPAKAIIKEFEHFEAVAYRDIIKPEIITLGWGFTYDFDASRKFSLGDTTSEYLSEILLDKIILEEIVPVLEKIPSWAILNDNQKAALIDFSFNLGKFFYGSVGFETITLCLKTGNNPMELTPSLRRVLNDLYPEPIPTQFKQSPTGLDLVALAFLMYRNPGTIAEEGLLRRRITEAQLWRKNDNN